MTGVRGLLDLDPTDQVLSADRLQQRGMVGGDMFPDRHHDLIIGVTADYEPALAADHLRHRISSAITIGTPARMGQGTAIMMA
jgi:hypothetical protein